MPWRPSFVIRDDLEGEPLFIDWKKRVMCSSPSRDRRGHTSWVLEGAGVGDGVEVVDICCRKGKDEGVDAGSTEVRVKNRLSVFEPVLPSVFTLVLLIASHSDQAVLFEHHGWAVRWLHGHGQFTPLVHSHIIYY
jgi:hypothetical protein